MRKFWSELSGQTRPQKAQNGMTKDDQKWPRNDPNDK